MPRHRTRVCSSIAVALVVVTSAAGGGAAGQPVGPSIRHHDLVAACATGALELTGTEEQHLPAGATVTVTDTVSEAGSTRQLSSSAIAVPVAVDTELAIDHDVLFRSATTTAAFTFVRVTRLFVDGSATTGTLVWVEEITATCTGEGPAAIAVRVESMAAPAGDDRAGPEAVVATPFYTG